MIEYKDVSEKNVSWEIFKMGLHKDRWKNLEVRNLPEAFILVSIKPGLDTVVRKTLDMKQIAEIYQVFGLYDLILKTKELEDMQQIEEIVAAIRQLDGITNTVTMLVRHAAPWKSNSSTL